MNINRNNYEEYFLLYIDNELSEAERKAVEAFVTANPDLASELDILRETILDKAIVQMPDKQSLFNFSDQSIHQKNYQEQFLLYVDNELNAAQKNDVETFVLQHPALQEEFMLLKQTVLPAEKIVFEDKASLYRKEKTRRPVIYLAFQRLSIAAVLTGLIAGGWLLFNKADVNNSAVAPTLAETKKENKKSEISVTNTTPAAYNRQMNSSSNIISKPVNTLNENSLTASDNKTKAAGSKNTQMFLDAVKETSISNPDESMAAVNQHTSQPAEMVQMNERDLIRKQVIQSIPSALDVPEIDAASKQNLMAANQLKVLNTEQEESDGILVGNLELNKSKLKGIFKKATSLFLPKTADNDGKIKVANLEIQTPNSSK